MSEHEQKADRAERELEELEQRSEHLQGEIEDASEDWESKKKDPGVPGATGDPDEGDGEGEGGDVAAEELDFGREVDKQDIVGEGAAPSDDDDES